MASSQSALMSKAGPSKPSSISLTKELMEKLKPAKVFSDAVDKLQSSSTNSGRALEITSITFDDTGERCVTAGEDDVFVLWDAKKGKRIRPLYSKKYGIAHARFTHRSQNIIHASTKLEDHAIRYHSMHDNKYLSYFRGHTARVRSLHMNPVDDTFVSAGDDGTVRLWDLRAPNCRGQLNDVGGSTIAAFDSGGKVFAVACSDTQTIALYAAESLDSAPFFHAPLIDVALQEIAQPPPKPVFTSIAFSNDENYLLIGTSSDVHYVLDAYTLVILRRLVGHRGFGHDRTGTKEIQPKRGTSGEEVGWSSDSHWVVSGSMDGTVLLWDLSSPPGKEKLEVPEVAENVRYIQKAPTLDATIVLQSGEGTSHAPTRAVRFNPRYCMLGVGGEELSFWLPEQSNDANIPEGW